jgi:hypothetical protein
VAVVRIEVRDVVTNDVVIDLLEVARTDVTDRLLGRAADAETAGDLLVRWIHEVLEPPGDDPVTFDRRMGDPIGRTLRGRIEEETS